MTMNSYKLYVTLHTSLVNQFLTEDLAKNGYFEEESFLNYLKYLEYWKKPEFLKYLKHPRCLDVLDQIQKPEVREELKKESFSFVLV